MAALKIQLRKSQLIHMIATKFKHPCFRGQEIRRNYCLGMSEITNGGHKPEVNRTYRISLILYMIATKFQQLHPCFRDQATQIDYWEYYPMSGLVGYQRWRPLTGSRQQITYISARIHDSNGIPKATPMFPGSGNTNRLMGILSYVSACYKSKMAAINREYMVYYA